VTATSLETALRKTLKDGDIQMEPTRFVDLLGDALRAMRSSFRGDPTSQLTTAEAAALRRGGLPPTKNFSAYERVRAKTAGELAALLARAHSTAEVAARLNVDPSRVRQLLAERRLLAARDGSEWRILDVQFLDQGLVPNIGQVVSALPDGFPVLVAASWLTSPEADLEFGDTPVSPLEWLSSGGDPDRVSALAAEL
jgi:excisionase family DNA binding protein